MNIEVQDHSAEVSAEIKAALLRGLEKCGLVAEGYAIIMISSECRNCSP